MVVIQEWWGVNHQVRPNSPHESFLRTVCTHNRGFVSSLVLRVAWTRQIIDVAKYVADKGFRTLVPDLYYTLFFLLCTHT